MITRRSSAVRLILKGARFIAANPDLTGPTELGITPACGATVAPIDRLHLDVIRIASASSSRQFARAFGLRLRVLIGGSKH